MAGDWQFVWRLTSYGWRLTSCGWRLASYGCDWEVLVGDWQVLSGDWQVIAGDWQFDWRLTGSGWRLTSYSWRLTIYDWRLTSSEWRLTSPSEFVKWFLDYWQRIGHVSRAGNVKIRLLSSSWKIKFFRFYFTASCLWATAHGWEVAQGTASLSSPSLVVKIYGMSAA